MIKWAGVTYRLHPLFSIIVLMSVLTGQLLELLTLFGIVLIHEIGHAAAARYFDWRLREVLLLPFGGVAVVDEQGSVPAREELIVAAAGPLQNALMIGLALFCTWAGWWDPSWSAYFIQANLAIALFNLIPVLPLDGGKILLALLSYRVRYFAAVRFSGWLGITCSTAGLMLAFAPIWKQGLQLNLLVICTFLFYSNWIGLRHARYHFVRFLVNRPAVLARMNERRPPLPLIVSSESTLHEIVERFLKERRHIVYVTDSLGRIGAVFTENRLIHEYFTDRDRTSAVSRLLM